MTPFLRRLVIAVVILAALVAAGWWLTRPKPIPVRLHEVATGRVEATLANTRAGTVEACQRTKLSTIMGGRIEYLGVKEGDRVKKGQLLLKLWNDDQQAQQALAASQLEVSKRRVVEACTLAASAQREAGRSADLKTRGFISESAEDASRTNAAARQAACETAKADVLQSQARLAAARVESRRITLTAPFDGTIARIVGEVGEYSTPSPPGVPTPPAIDLIDDSCLYVKAPMDEVDAPKIHPGQSVRIRLDAYPQQDFAGKVRRVAPFVTAVEKQARTVDVEVDFVSPEKSAGLLVGYSADVEILLEERPAVLRIPTATLQEGRRVLVFAAATGKLEARQIRTGLANWEFTEVIEGLSAGERIVLSLEKEGVKPGAHAVEEAATGVK
ncbi:MAG: efflux RND transporter periplasmic adaptor subunit [Rhodocyclaceae bacterium]